MHRSTSRKCSSQAPQMPSLHPGPSGAPRMLRWRHRRPQRFQMRNICVSCLRYPRGVAPAQEKWTLMTGSRTANQRMARPCDRQTPWMPLHRYPLMIEYCARLFCFPQLETMRSCLQLQHQTRCGTVQACSSHLFAYAHVHGMCITCSKTLQDPSVIILRHLLRQLRYPGTVSAWDVATTLAHHSTRVVAPPTSHVRLQLHCTLALTSVEIPACVSPCVQYAAGELSRHSELPGVAAGVPVPCVHVWTGGRQPHSNAAAPGCESLPNAQTAEPVAAVDATKTHTLADKMSGLSVCLACCVARKTSQAKCIAMHV